MFGPTTGDCVRLGDSSLLAQVEHDHLVYGDECLCGGGKTVRDGMAISSRTNAQGVLDLLVANALIIEPVLGIVKGDVGIKDGRIVAVGKAGNPTIMDGVDEKLVVGNSTAVESVEGKIVTAGGIDVHTHFVGADQCHHALSSGLTTLIGGGMSRPFIEVDQGAPVDIFRMLRACEAFPVNFGLFARGSSHCASAIGELMDCGVIGVKIHEDFGAPPRSSTLACRWQMISIFRFSCTPTHSTRADFTKILLGLSRVARCTCTTLKEQEVATRRTSSPATPIPIVCLHQQTRPTRSRSIPLMNTWI